VDIGEVSNRAVINGAELEFWDFGSGPAILFIHGGMGEECAEVLKEPLLSSRFRLIHFQRRGYGNSACPEMPVSIEQHARDGMALLAHLGVDAAHVVGQSYGGAVSLQLALQAPGLIQSLTVAEPALPAVIFASAEFAALGAQAGELYQNGGHDAAIELFGRAVVGEKCWDSFAADWLSLWTGDATVIFESDLVSLGEWNFGAAEAHKISQPVMSLVGTDSPDVFKNVAEVIAEWISQAENYVVPDSSHTIMQMNPGHAAQLITDFVERHPIA
jgi:pimeloyl-ACP methyl ester carboxylesterase